jgi:hypothetical protein
MRATDWIVILLFTILWPALFYKNNTIQVWFNERIGEVYSIVIPITAFIFVIFLTRLLKNKITSNHQEKNLGDFLLGSFVKIVKKQQTFIKQPFIICYSLPNLLTYYKLMSL